MTSSPLLQVDSSRCNNCRACLSVCPAKGSIDSSGDVIVIKDERCLGCGKCVASCRRQAITFRDNTEAFFKDLATGVPAVVIMSSSISAIFPDRYKLNAYLKFLGVSACFDLDFGEKLAAKSLSEYERLNPGMEVVNPKTEATVKWYEVYRPEELGLVAPIQSAVSHAAILVRTFFPEYEICKIAVVSADIPEGYSALTDYTISAAALGTYVASRNQNIDFFAPQAFDGPGYGIPPKNSLSSALNQYWQPNIYKRAFQDQSALIANYAKPDKTALKALYARLGKETEDDFLNCGSCGYGSCAEMAEGLYNELTKPENCRRFLETEYRRVIGLLAQSKVKQEEEATNKSAFLAATSHAIRSPVNDILALTEHLLKKSLPLDAYDEAVTLRQAATILSVKVNEALDFSNVESGILDISPSEYRLSSLLEDCMAIQRMKLMDKPLTFCVNVDASLPDSLFGDEVRVRQILLSLLTAAAKGNGGSMSLDVGGMKQSERLLLRFTVASSTQPSFSPETEELENCRTLCRLMGGDVITSITDGNIGRVTASVQQKIVDFAGESLPVAVIHSAERKPVLLFEGRLDYSESVMRSLRNLGVPGKQVTEMGTFAAELRSGAYAFALVPSSAVDLGMGIIKEEKLPTTLVVLANLGEVTLYPDVPVVGMPAWAVPLAGALNTTKSDRPTVLYKMEITRTPEAESELAVTGVALKRS